MSALDMVFARPVGERREGEHPAFGAVVEERRNESGAGQVETTGLFVEQFFGNDHVS
ncbi:hypothetical protein [Saccharopolyspora sp. NPDC002376]